MSDNDKKPFPPLFAKEEGECSHEYSSVEWREGRQEDWKYCHDCGTSDADVQERVAGATYTGEPILEPEAQNLCRCPECGALVQRIRLQYTAFTFSLEDGEHIVPEHHMDIIEIDDHRDDELHITCTMCDADWDSVAEYVAACAERTVLA